MERGPAGAPRRATRADVARRAGVSAATVSYALDETSRKVSDETRARVLEAATALGYQPNVAARALKLGSTAQLGLVVPGVLNRFFAEITDHAEAAADRHGLALLVTSARGGPGLATAQLAGRQVDGVVLATGRDADLGPLRAGGIPAATVGFRLDGVPGVGADRYQGARDAVEHLVSHGHSHIGFIGPAHRGRRRQAWLDVLAETGGTPSDLPPTDFSRSLGYQAGQALAAMADRPTAVFITSDEQAVGVLLALHEAGVRVPEDLAIVSFDGSQEAAYSWPPLTTVAQPLAEMVTVAVDRVLGDRTGYSELATSLVVRRSCGC